MSGKDGNDSILVTNQPMCTEIARSSLYTLIPVAVRSRIPILTSIRRSARSAVSNKFPKARSGSALGLSNRDVDKELESCGFASTVPNSALSTPQLRPQTPDDGVRTTDLSLTMLPQPVAQSGVNWDVASTGIRLWITAKQQSEQNGDNAALRSMHIDAVRYMHMALPSDLTPLEIENLRTSLPPALVTSAELGIGSSRPTKPPTMLRRSIAQMVCWTLAMLLFVLPILMSVLNRALQLAINIERQHQLSSRVVSNSLDLVSALGERGSKYHEPIMRLKQGPLGSACIDTASWLIEGVIGGVNDGLDAAARNRTRASC